MSLSPTATVAPISQNQLHGRVTSDVSAAGSPSAPTNAMPQSLRPNQLTSSSSFGTQRRRSSILQAQLQQLQAYVHRGTGVLARPVQLTLRTQTIRRLWVLIFVFQTLNAVQLIEIANLYLAFHRQGHSLLGFLVRTFLDNGELEFVERFSLCIGLAYLTLGVMFAYLGLVMVARAVKTRDLSFRDPIRRLHPSTRKSGASRRKSSIYESLHLPQLETSVMGLITRCLRRQWKLFLSLFVAYGVRGERFEQGLLVREFLDICVQSFQAYSASCAISNLWVTQAYGVVLALSATMNPLIARFYADHVPMKRFVTVFAEFSIDFCWGTILPLWMFVPYMFLNRDMTADDVLRDMGMGYYEKAQREIRQILILSWRSFFVSIFPFLSALLSLRGIRKLLEAAKRADNLADILDELAAATAMSPQRGVRDDGVGHRSPRPSNPIRGSGLHRSPRPSNPHRDDVDAHRSPRPSNPMRAAEAPSSPPPATGPSVHDQELHASREAMNAISGQAQDPQLAALSSSSPRPRAAGKPTKAPPPPMLKHMETMRTQTGLGIAVSAPVSRVTARVHQAFILYGVGILLLSISASGIFRWGRATAVRFRSDDCLYQLSPWFAVREACVGRVVNCTDLGMTGEASEVEAALAAMDRKLLSAILFLDCPKLEIPATLRSLGGLRTLAIKDSRIRAWPAAAALSAEAFPVLTNVFVENVTFDSTPEGLTSSTWPSATERCLFIHTDISGFVHALTNEWAQMRIFYCQDCGLTLLPPVLGRVPRLEVLVLAEMPTPQPLSFPGTGSSSPSETALLMWPSLRHLTLRNNPWLGELPVWVATHMKSGHLRVLDLQRTNISSLPLPLPPDPTDTVILGHDSPLCDGGGGGGGGLAASSVLQCAEITSGSHPRILW